MPGPEIRVRRHEQRPSSSNGTNDAAQRNNVRGSEKGKMKEKRRDGTLDGWVEPTLAAPKPSYQDQGAGPYGVLEHMQPLGEAPNAKVKARVKGDGSRKSVLGRSSAAVGGDAQETPEGSPAPAAATPQPQEPAVRQPIVIDDEKDEDYAPTMNGKKKDRTLRARAAKRKSELASSAPPPSATPVKVSTPPAPAPPQIKHKFELNSDKLRSVVDAAKDRAVEVGKQNLAFAVQEIYEQSLTDVRLRILLETVLGQKANASQNAEFQDYVRAAKKKLKEAKNRARQHSASKPNGTLEKTEPGPPPQTAKVALQQATPSAPGTSRAIPSTETLEMSKPKLSLKGPKSPVKDAGQRNTTNGTTSVSPRKRAGSVGSDSSLTSLTSNEDDDDMDIDEPSEPPSNFAGSSTRPNGAKGKDHAAERGSLAVPGSAAVKRSSAEAELEAERDRVFAAKKQKLSEGLTRDFEYEESSIRPSIPAPPRSRPQNLRESVLGRPSLKLEPHGSRATSTRGSRAESMDLESPLTELSPATSRQSTPRVFAPKPTVKRAKTKQSPEKKQQQQAAYSGMPGAGGAGRDSPIRDDDNEEASENNDFCSACGGSGYLLCCDGCDRSFHFTCLDPPLNENAKELDEPWFCFMCVEKRPAIADSPEKAPRGLGLFAPLISSLKKRNPKNFELPVDLREYFEGVAIDKNGSFVEALHATKHTRSRPGYSDEQPDYYKMRDSKGNFVHCYACGKTSQGRRAIVTCDHCSQHWHLDCLDPPLANPPALNQNGKKVHDWMCPLHSDQELRRVDMSVLGRRTIHVRKPKNPNVVDTSLSRGFRNNGIIEVAEDDTDASDSEFYDLEDSGIVYKLPAGGIKLDFIDKVKESRIQNIRDANASYKRARVSKAAPNALQQANFAKRPFSEKQVALQLAQFANENKDLNLGGDRVEDLVGTLIAEAPSDVVDLETAAEEAEAQKTKSASSVIPPSPPSSEQPEQLSAEQRRELQLLQELIRRRLEGKV